MNRSGVLIGVGVLIGSMSMPPPVLAQSSPTPTPSPSPSPIPSQGPVSAYTTSGTFSQGGSYTGSFQFDFGTGTYTDLQISTSVGGGLPGAQYTLANLAFGNSNGFTLFSSTSGFRATFNSSITPDTPSFTTDFSESDFPSDSNRFGSAGSVQAVQAAPEPGSWALMILGFGIVGYAMRTRRVRYGKLARAV